MKEQDFEKYAKKELDAYGSPMDMDAFLGKLRRNRRRRILLWWWLLPALLLLFGGGLAAYFSWPAHQTESTAFARQAPGKGQPVPEAEKGAALINSPLSLPNDDEKQEVSLIRTTTTGEQVMATRPASASGGAARVLREKTLPPIFGKEESLADTAMEQAEIQALPPVGGQVFPEEGPAAHTSGALASLLPLPLPAPPAWPGPVVDIQGVAREIPADKAVRRIRLYLETETGLLFSNRKLSPTPAMDTTTYLDDRRATERALETIQASLLGRVQFPSGFYLRAGGSYTRTAERFDHLDSLITERTVQGVQEIIISPSGDSTFINGPLTIQEGIYFRKRTYNSLHLLDVPFIGGYAFQRGAFYFDLEAGVFLNIHLRAKGEILSPDGDFLSLEESTFRKNLGLSFYAGLRARYQLDERWSLLAGPSFRYFPDAFSQEGAPVEQGYQHWGIQLGLSVRLK